MAAIFTDTSTQLNTPLSHCSVDNVLTEVTPLFHQTLQWMFTGWKLMFSSSTF